ncbi:MAG: ribosome silencing factor [Desulfobacterales bacterium]|nr:ribosome silencing factor [Desulfobacterales bacterium]
MTAIPEEITPYLAPIFERKPLSVAAIDVRELTSYTDTVVIVEASSNRQARALSEHIVTALKKQDKQVLGAEGIKEGEWALLDYGDIVIHVFESEARTFYDIDGLWSDAPRMDLSEYGMPGEA